MTGSGRKTRPALSGRPGIRFSYLVSTWSSCACTTAASNSATRARAAASSRSCCLSRCSSCGE